MKILVTPTSLQPGKNPEVLKLLENFSKDLIFNETGRPLKENELIPLLKDCDGYIAGLDFITRKVIDSCPKLKVISRYGTGYDRVDIQAAKDCSILVTNTPGVNAEAVGELAFALALSAARRIPNLHMKTASGEWVRSCGIELKNKTLGIVGLGAIGKVVARCAFGFQMNVIAYDPFLNSAYCYTHNIKPQTLDELLTASDVISLHLPLTPETAHIINHKTLAQMKPSTILINTSRGGLIDEAAAYEALKNNRLGGLGLDAFESEPPSDCPLFHLENVTLTPHTGAHTKEATQNMAYTSIQNLIDILSGVSCPNIVNS